ncbi:hypothetical protein PR048_031987 [Dryococelus australis]|uniref:Mutator-like transposase domain-containing protein n=1 Tax=Dryococelus australis TaxID=614101 RepID=A0ABQ9G6V4_9NEOP|nr:hypothetical protein PR048_031987 [Dryococelus australis]
MPILTVVADCNWPKHSFMKNYSSLSGKVAIVGFHAGKLLFLCWRYNIVLLNSRAENSGISVKQHICYKNYSRSSTNMESGIIIDGILLSVEIYGMKYGAFIADCDSSMYTIILQARPYDDLKVEKVECINQYCEIMTESYRTLLRMEN